MFSMFSDPPMRNFIIVTTIFALIFIAMSIYHVTTWWVWLLFIIVWTLAEWQFAKEVHLKWWQWTALILGLSVIDVIVLSMT